MKARFSPAVIIALAAVWVAPSSAPAALRGAEAGPSVVLPGDVTASTVRADPSGWIVGARPGSASTRIARAHGAKRITGSAWLVRRDRARALARALKTQKLLTYAEPDRLSVRAQAPVPDPLSALSPWRERVVAGAIPPPAGAASPLIALVDSQLDTGHPEFAAGNVTTTGGRPLTDFHGTATAAVASAAANGVGNLGVWPGARTLNVALPQQIRCSDSASQIRAAVRAGAAVINMSYGSRSRCEAEADAIQRAVRAGIVPVAASGNEFAQGNPLEFPASLPHVVTVSALGAGDTPAFFSSDSAAVDLSAPGQEVLTAVPVSRDEDFDPDRDGDGFALVSGTSFSAPMVSAAVAWVRAARPDLTGAQVADVVRFGARDIGNPGYENATGYGILDLPGALARPAPPIDPAEPNDDIRYVDGRAFGSAAPPVYPGRGTAVVSATADVAEDPVDVYRIKVRRNKQARIGMRLSVGDADLYVFSGQAGNINQGSRLVGRSRRSGATDAVTIRNRGRGTATYYVAVGFTRGKDLDLLNATYRLSIRP